MNGLIPSPDPLGIPAPGIVFHALYILTFVLHFIFMNYILGGTIMLTVHDWLLGQKEHVAQSNVLMLRVMPVALSMAITMGVAPLLFVQVMYGQFFYTANILMGGYWLAIIGLVMAGFYIIYLSMMRRTASGRPTPFSKAGVLINTFLFLIVAFLYTNNAVLTENPQLWKDIYTGQRWIIAPDLSLWPRYLHNVIGSIAVAGLWCAVIGQYQLRFHPERSESGKWMTKVGLHWATAATTFEILIGFIYLLTLGMDRIKALMGNGFLFVGWSISVVTAFIMLGLLVMAMMKPENTKLLWGSVGLMVVTLFGMAMGRLLMRMISLEEYIQELALNPSYSSLALFLVTFVAGLVVIAYLIRLVWTLPEKK